MSNQITHQPDADGVMRQIVSAKTLRAVLDADGSDYTRPPDFGPADEWDVGAQDSPIISYVVRVPGNTSWSEHRTERAAHREANVADRTCRPGHLVYALHQDGSVTGPLDRG